jgi:hypothetical protein
MGFCFPLSDFGGRIEKQRETGIEMMRRIGDYGVAGDKLEPQNS